MVRSLKLGVALACGVPLFIVFTVFSYLTWTTESREQRSLLVEKSAFIAEQLTHRFDWENSLPLTQEEQLSAGEFLEEIAQKTPEISYLSLLNPFGHIASHSQSARGKIAISQEDKERVYEIRSPQYFPDLQEVYVPLFSPDHQLFGLLRVGIAEEGFRGLVFSFFIRVVLLGALSIGVATWFSVFLVRRFLSRSLAPLMNSIDRVSEGDFTRRVDTAFVRAELLPFTSSLNRLFESVESDKRKIHRFRSEMSEYEKILVSTKNQSMDQLQGLDRKASQLEEKFKSILRLSWQGIMVFDETGKILEHNPEVRRLIRFDHHDGHLYVPEQIQRMIACLFVSSSKERVEGTFELTDNIFLKSSRCRFRAQRLPSVGGCQKVLVILEDSTRLELIEKEKSDFSELIRHSVIPVLNDLKQEIFNLQATEGNPPDLRILRKLNSWAVYLSLLMDDWAFWDGKTHLGDMPSCEKIDLTVLLESLKQMKLGGFSKEIRFHVRPQELMITGGPEDYRRIIRETYTLLQLAVPGLQDSAVDAIAEPDAIVVLFRKREKKEGGWKPPEWIQQFSEESALSQDSWARLKISIVRFLANLYHIKVKAELIQHDEKQGLLITLEFPLKQLKKSQDTHVDDLIKKFFVLPV